MAKFALLAAVVTVSTLGFNSLLPQVAPQGGKQKQGGKKEGGQKQGNKSAYPLPKSAWSIASLNLGCPTDSSVVVTIQANEAISGCLEYQEKGASSWMSTPTQEFGVGQPVPVKLGSLRKGAEYSYRLAYRGAQGEGKGPEDTFRTQRAPGTGFTFFVQGDSHPERVPKMHVPSVYERILLTAKEQNPDFFICMGDDFSVDTLHELTKQTVEGVYRKQVPYLGLVGAPLYLVNGNHEQASKANLNGTADCVPVWAQNARNTFFAQPAPDGFYTGNSEKVEHIGLLRNYFAWTWGDALFVVIDPYWHSNSAVDNKLSEGPGTKGGGKGNRNLWDITLGDAQYSWLKNTLAGSSAKYKFVFAHHVHGTGRGGVEQAAYYEWGGKDRNGANVFKSKRPGWEVPIHQLFVKTGVSIFFQGHDHVFCKQELDGVIYQSCPCPADPTNSLINGDAYTTGDKVPGAGLVRVSVAPQETKVDYVRAYEPEAERDGHKHGEIAYSYPVKPRGSK